MRNKIYETPQAVEFAVKLEINIMSEEIIAPDVEIGLPIEEIW